MGKHHSKAYWKKYYALQAESKMEFENPSGATYKALDEVSTVSSVNESGKCRVHQGDTWRGMSGKPVILSTREKMRTNDEGLTYKNFWSIRRDYESTLRAAQRRKEDNK